MSWSLLFLVLRGAVRSLLLVILLLLSVGSIFYLNSYWYDFKPSERFSGNKYYNPYQNIDLSKGFMSNFHAHSDCWNGLLNGYGTDDEVMSTYNQLGYDLFGLSNYHQVSGSSNNGLHTYEHGWGIGKVHQLVIGGSNVCWLDFPLYQNVNQKQTILYNLKEKNPDAVIVLAHPSLRNAYSEEEIVQLEGAHCFEAINKLRKSKRLWDDVLSQGKYLSIIGSDDCHDIRKPSDIGRCGTFVFSQNPLPDIVKSSLKYGRTLAVEFIENADSSVQKKKESISKRIRLRSINVSNDSILVEAHEKFKMIRVIADHSDTLHTFVNVSNFEYLFPSIASYTRIEFETYDGRVLYSNPISRSATGKMDFSYEASVNAFKTGVYRFIIIFTISLLWLLILVKRNEKISRKLDNRFFGDILYRRNIHSTARDRRGLTRIGK